MDISENHEAKRWRDHRHEQLYSPGKWQYIVLAGIFVMLSLAFHHSSNPIGILAIFLTLAVLESHFPLISLFYLLIGLSAFQRYFAYCSLTLGGVPLYVTEFVIAINLLWLAISFFSNASIKLRPVSLFFLPFIGLGILLGLFGFWEHGIQAIRHSAIAYYALISVIVLLRVRGLDLAGNLLRTIYYSMLAGLSINIVNIYLNLFDEPFSKHGMPFLAAATFLMFFFTHRGERKTPGLRFYPIMILILYSMLVFPKSSYLIFFFAAVVVSLAYNLRFGNGIKSMFVDSPRVLVPLVLSLIVAILIAIIPGNSDILIGSSSEIISAAKIIQDTALGDFEIIPRDSGGMTLDEYLLTIEAQQSNFAWRIIVWRHAFDNFLKHPVLGIGFGISFAPRELLKYNYKWYPDMRPHNSYLHILMRMGILGLIVFCVALVPVIYYLWRKNIALDRCRLNLLMMAFSGMLGFGVMAFLNVVHENAYGAVPFWTFAALAILIATNPSKTKMVNSESSAD